MNYRLSSSTIKKFTNCPFSFYCKITKQNQDSNKEDSYGKAGNVVHNILEYYYKELTDIPTSLALNALKPMFNEMWDDYEIDNPKIDKDLYWLSVINGVKLNVKPTHLEYEFTFTDPVNFIGYADVMNIKEHWIGDWKTSTYKKSKLEDYKNQLKYYAYCYWKEHKVVPMTWVFFNKVNKLFKFKFTESHMKAVESHLIEIEKDIKSRMKEMRFERNPSRTNCFFCPFKSTCATDLLRESKSPTYEVIFHLKKNKLLVEGAIPDLIHRKIEQRINYKVKNAQFIIKAMKMKGINYDGIKRLYRRREYGGETFIGYMYAIHDILKEYATSEGKKLRLVLKDWRNQEVMKSEIKFNNSLNVPYKFYDFQTKAVDTLIKKRWGVVEIGTGGGKTAIAAECIRRCATKTLFVIDNKDLLLQTKQEYETMLEQKCGIVGMGRREWDFPVVLATIQTLAKHLKLFENQLSNFNLVIFDETHIIATKSFEKLSGKLINTKYRFGFSATAKRDDLNDNVIFAHTGEVVFKKKALDLIDEGVLVKPKAFFYKYDSETSIGENWQNEYNEMIVENDERNKIIFAFAEKYARENTQVMILCKLIKHCDYLHKNIPGSKLIYGRTEDDVREDVIREFKEGKFNILIGNIKIFNKGIDIKNLVVLINAAGNAGDVLTIQSIGRALRKNKGKNAAIYIDFFDHGEYCLKHSKSRIDALRKEGYEVEVLDYENQS
jgi:superfamily II DNA or RNA helicase/CRISPR/Cas system-associated exonuclease Cas4 (RecB family)